MTKTSDIEINMMQKYQILKLNILLQYDYHKFTKEIVANYTKRTNLVTDKYKYPGNGIGFDRCWTLLVLSGGFR